MELEVFERLRMTFEASLSQQVSPRIGPSRGLWGFLGNSRPVKQPQRECLGRDVDFFSRHSLLGLFAPPENG